MVYEAENITEDEAALYDRQIRLWGLDAQKRLRAASVLLIGLKGLGAEIAKNIVLSGVKSVTLMDHSTVTEEDASAQFLVSRDDVGKNRAESSKENAQKLNPMVTVSVDTDKVADKPDEFFTKFRVICATCCSKETLLRLNNLTRRHDMKFLAGDVYGYYGFSFTDFIQHEYAEEITKMKNDDSKGDENNEPPAKKKKTTETTVVRKEMEFSSLQDSLHIDWTGDKYKNELKRTPKGYFITQVMMAFLEKFGHLPNSKTHLEDKKQLLNIRSEVLNALKVDSDILTEDFIQHCIGELSPVCAVVGGIMGQEVIKAVSHKDAPLRNFFFFDGTEGCGLVDNIGG
ncbi:SUMO-activating enzyme subunit 1-like [Tubulanus polymorphus]|uniref:SUMO-activating enzyme subunit 1-like n=1 Tax=Tubulanus polymorphus TaxID=672921 RepID=UPI003DA52831